MALEGEEDDDRVEQPVEGEGSETGQQLGLVPFPAPRSFAEGAGEEPRHEWDAEEDGDCLGDLADRQVQSDGAQAEPAGQDLQVEVAEEREGDHLEERVDGHEHRGGLPVPARQVVPDEDHGDAAGQADDYQPGSVGGRVRQQQPGQREHDRRSDHPIQHQGRDEHPSGRG